MKDFFDTTVELMELLEKEKQIDRDEKIEKIEELLEKREGFMAGIKPPFSQVEQQYLQQLIDLNKKLNQLLEGEKNAIQKDINHLNKQKQSSEKYTNPYESLATDGIFYDKRF